MVLLGLVRGSPSGHFSSLGFPSESPDDVLQFLVFRDRVHYVCVGVQQYLIQDGTGEKLVFPMRGEPLIFVLPQGEEALLSAGSHALDSRLLMAWIVFWWNRHLANSLFPFPNLGGRVES